MIPDSSPRLTDRRWFWPVVGLCFFGLYYALRNILTPFLIALFIGYLCQPIINRLNRLGLPRTGAACLILVVMLLFFVGFLVLFIPLLQAEAIQFFRQILNLAAAFNEKISPLISRIIGYPIQLDATSLQKFISQNIGDLSNLGISMLKYVSARGSALLSLAITTLMVPLILFYTLRDLNRFVSGASQLIPRRIHNSVVVIASEMNELFFETIRGQLLVILIQSFLYGLALWIAGLNFAFAIGTITGLLSVIPYFGFTIGLILGLATAALQFDSLLPILGVLAAFGVVQVFESFFLTPNIVGDRIGLHPVGVIFSLLAFGELFGFTGILIALPATSLIVVGLRHLNRAYINSRFYNGPTAFPVKDQTAPSQPESPPAQTST